MQEIITQVVVNNGVTGLIFLIFFIYHRDQMKAWEQRRADDMTREGQQHQLYLGLLEATQALVVKTTQLEEQHRQMFCLLSPNQKDRGQARG
ncbi:hypothetical protein [Fundidesulfovibrio putealis]|uniref:hypothetical protein n=1 Tax=Fundidesulfovibrio putealis TaxID=270496 RepID=UPI000414B493|nr:hypothetical protein [Fundidesulfovibrio putealis]